MESRSTSIGSLPNRSSTSTSRSLLMLTSPFTSWYIPGRDRSLQLVSLQISKISEIFAREAEGIATIISSIPKISAHSMILSLPPTTLIPWMNLPHLPESSSMIHRITMVEKLLLTISLMITFAASPAPITITEILLFLFCCLCFKLRKNR